jgi:hypothetical protein
MFAIAGLRLERTIIYNLLKSHGLGIAMLTGGRYLVYADAARLSLLCIHMQTIQGDRKMAIDIKDYLWWPKQSSNPKTNKPYGYEYQTVEGRICGLYFATEADRDFDVARVALTGEMVSKDYKIPFTPAPPRRAVPLKLEEGYLEETPVKGYLDEDTSTEPQGEPDVGPKDGPFANVADLVTWGVLPAEKKEATRHGSDFRHDLIDPTFTWSMALMAAYGASRYGDDNWKLSRLDGDKGPINHALAHINAYQLGEPHDHFGGRSWHLISAAYNLMMESWYSQNLDKIDDEGK